MAVLGQSVHRPKWQCMCVDLWMLLTNQSVTRQLRCLTGLDHYRQFPARIPRATNLRVDGSCNIGAPNSAVVLIWLALFKYGQVMN
jgi:hypothetical protein